MKHKLFTLFAILSIILLLQSCSDYPYFDRATVTMTISNPTNHVVNVSINNIVLNPGEERSTLLQGDTIPHSFSCDWGDTLYFVYDDSVEVKHVCLTENGNVFYYPALNNILDANSWDYIGNRTFKYIIDSPY